MTDRPRQPEPWLRGPIDGLHPVASHLLYTFEQAREELAYWTAGLEDHVWTAPSAQLAPLGFQLRHIKGSVNRLATYLAGEQLSDEQLAALRSELVPGESLASLLAALFDEFSRVERIVRGIAVTAYLEPRFVGRKRLPTTVCGLIVHLSEHTQRHLGQAVLTAKMQRTS